ncbi:MAG TPA: hypothetical protein VHI54_03190 [Actinomycetota bacterium]|nr:hypothetical protein [Actinomycetota bacterium]
MRFGIREILLAVAVVLFLLAVFVEGSFAELIALGLAAFAAGVLLTGVDVSRWGGRGLR